MTLFFQDNVQLPRRPEAHLDEEHPLEGKELEIVAVGGPASPTDKTRLACSPRDFKDGKNYTGKIVLLMRGSPCVFTDKAVNAERAGAAIVLSITDEVMNSYILELIRDAGEELSSVNSSILAGFIPHTGGQQVLDHLDAGGSARGMLVSKCTPTPMDPATLALDECPTVAEANTKQVGGCAGAANVTDRLCARCQAELVVAGTPKLCLRGNDLLPRKAATQFWSSRTLPADVGDVVYLVRPPGLACVQSDFAPYAGKVVVVSRSLACSMYTSAVVARRAGVSAIVIAADSGCLTPRFCVPKYYRVEGPSVDFGIPVHAVAWKTFLPFRIAATTRPLTPSGDAHVLGRASVAVGAWDEVPAPPPVPTEQTLQRVLAEDGDFEWSTTIVVCLVLILLLLVLIAGMCRQSQRKSVTLGPATRFSVPLGLASTALTVTLLVTITLTTFFLVYTAGQDSVDTARADGRVAVSDTFSNAVKNIEELNQRWAETVTDVVHDVTYDFFMEAVRMVTTTQLTMVTYGGTWTEAENLWQPMLSVSHLSKWHLAIRTKEGFFFNKDYTTDARPDNVRNDGLPHVSITNNGRLYPNLHQFKFNKRVPYSYRVRTTDWWDPMQKVGGLYADPLSLVDHFVPESKDAHVWITPTYSAKLTWPTMMAAPFSLLVPAFNVVTRRLVGAIEAQVDGRQLSRRLISTLSLYPNIGNLTAFVVREDGVVFACNRADIIARTDRFRSDTANSATLMFDTDSVQNLEMRAMAVYLKETNGGKLIPSATGHGVFDQALYYREKFDLEQLSFRFENDLTDSGPEKLNAFVTGGTAKDMLSGGSIRFTGKEVMTISTFKSVHAWNVQGTKVGSYPFRSSFRLFNYTEVIDGNEVVVTKDYKGVPLLPVLIPPFFAQSFTFSVDVRPEGDVPASDEPQFVPNFPRIFGDAPGGTATLRLFANGVFYFGLESLGCVTAPIPLPKGDWTNIIVTMRLDSYTPFDPNVGACYVYSNGTLASENKLSQSTWEIASQEDYEVGRNFAGRLDNLMVLNTTVNAEEASRLYRDGQYTRSVSPKRWFYNYREVTVPGSPPMKLTSGILLPEEDILRSVLLNNKVTRENLRVKETNTHLDLKVSNTAFVIAFVGLASVVVFLLFNSLLTSPFADMALLMLDAALLRVDTIPAVKSGITELQQMQHSLFILLLNLREFRNYLPQTLLLDCQDDANDGNSRDEGTFTAESGRSAKSQSSSVGCASPKHLAQNVAAALEVATILTTRRVTIAVLNIKGFHVFVKQQGDKMARQEHSRWAEYMLEHFTSMRGVAEPFLGDKFPASFNGAKAAGGHQLAACTCLITALEYFNSKGIQVSSAVATGDMRVGNMGCAGMRRFSYISPTVSWAYTLERVACENDWSVVTDSHTVGAVADEILFKTLGAVTFAKCSSTPLTICELAGCCKVVAVEEWMYQLESRAANDPFAKWNEFAGFVLTECWEVCRLHSLQHRLQYAQDAIALQPTVAAIPDFSIPDLYLEFAAAIAARRYVPMQYRVVRV